MIKNKYGKFINGELVVHGKNHPIVNENGTFTITSDHSKLTSNGFKLLVYTECPSEDNKTYYETWVEKDETIVQNWTSEDVDETPDIEERLSALESAFLEYVNLTLGGE